MSERMAGASLSTNSDRISKHNTKIQKKIQIQTQREQMSKEIKRTKRILAAYILNAAEQRPAHLLVHYNSEIGHSLSQYSPTIFSQKHCRKYLGLHILYEFESPNNTICLFHIFKARLVGGGEEGIVEHFKPLSRPFSPLSLRHTPL